jgi:dipeptidyl aminopeptidase/acylaminoacyl peptidase
MKLAIILLSVLSITQCAIPFTALAMHKLKRMSGSTVVNNYIVYSVRHWNDGNGKTSTHLEYKDITTGKTYMLTTPTYDVSDYNPVYSDSFPNTLFFLSDRDKDKSVQLYSIKFPSVNEVPLRITNIPVPFDNLKIQKNTIVFSAEVYFSCKEDVLQCTADLDAKVQARGKNTWGTYTKMFVRHWDVWTTEGKGNHLFAIKLFAYETEFLQLGELPIIDLMQGMEANSPVPPFGGAELYDISPDGNELVFTAHLRNNEESWKTNWKTYWISNINNPVPVLILTEDFVGRTQNPSFSPDGKLVSFLYMIRVGLESDNLHLAILDKTTNKITKITDTFDRSILGYTWYDNESLFFTATDIDRNKLFYLNISKQDGPIIINNEQYSWETPFFVNSSNGDVYAERSGWSLPTVVAGFKFDKENQKTSEVNHVVDVNENTLYNYKLVEPESFMFKGGNDEDVNGWIQKPVNFDSTKTYPVALLIHGGPEEPWDPSWSYRWNPQMISQRGYVVVMINPHGSPGMGIKFQDAVRNDWGGVPYQDIMKGLDYAIENYKFLDKDRVCALGASYGGYMVNWIQGQTDRFKCLVTHDGVFSAINMFYATEEIWFPLAENCPIDKPGCTPFDEATRENYTKFSPETFVKNWKTPHLVVHGTYDFRIPVSEGLSVFTALQVRGVPSKLLHFAQENHWVNKPENSIKWHQEVLDWIDEWTSKK